MKKLLLIVGLLWSAIASAQFVPGQVLTAAELNSAFANTAPAPGITCLGASSALNYTSNTFSCNAAINAVTLGGATFSAPGPIGSVSTSSGAFSSVSTPSATIGGGAINATTVGSTSASTGAFTTLSASGTVSGVGFTNLLSPYLTTASAASTYAPLASPNLTGVPTAPTVSATTSTTQIATTAMVNSAVTSTSLGGGFTTLTASSTVSGAGFTTLLSPYLLSATAASTYAPLASPTFTGVPAAPNAAAGTNTTQLATTAFVEGTLQSPQVGIGSVAPNTGAFTTLSSTGNFTPSQTNGIVGTTTNNNANAGSVGEAIAATNSGGTAMTSNSPLNVASISLTAGDWDVYGNVVFSAAAAMTAIESAVSTTSVTFPALTTGNAGSLQLSFGAGTTQSLLAPPQRLSLSTTTTVYLVGLSSFASSTVTAFGTIFARRRR